MELPEKLINQLEREKVREDKLRKKLLATQQYRRRKLDKDVRQYCKDKSRLRSSEINEIGERHKFFIS